MRSVPGGVVANFLIRLLAIGLVAAFAVGVALLSALPYLIVVAFIYYLFFM
jgi:hypothetical protein